jgi:aryl-alcohol dehydrogenase-like predicted oxidoreductase
VRARSALCGATVLTSPTASRRSRRRVARAWRKLRSRGSSRRMVSHARRCFGRRVLISSRSGVSAPIVGTSSLENLKELIEAVHIKLNDEEMKALEEPYKPVAIVGHA